MEKPVLTGDLTPYFISIKEASVLCGISTSTINRNQGITFPPKKKISAKRQAFATYQVHEWLFEDKRGGWS